MTISKLTTSASLKEVMDKFEEISLHDLSSIDIVVKSELPSNVKNGQLVIIDSNINLNVIASANLADEDVDNIFIFTTDKKKEYSYDATSKKNTLKMYINYIRKHSNGIKIYLNSYLGVNGEWIQITNNNIYIFKDGVFINEDTLGIITKKNGTLSITNDKNLKFYSSNQNGFNMIGSKAIDFSKYTSLHVEFASVLHITGYTTNLFGIVANQTTTTYSKSFEIKRNVENEIISIDLSNVNITGYLRFNASTVQQSGENEMQIKTIRLV